MFVAPGSLGGYFFDLSTRGAPAALRLSNSRPISAQPAQGRLSARHLQFLECSAGFPTPVEILVLGWRVQSRPTIKRTGHWPRVSLLAPDALLENVKERLVVEVLTGSRERSAGMQAPSGADRV